MIPDGLDHALLIRVGGTLDRTAASRLAAVKGFEKNAVAPAAAAARRVSSEG